MSIGVGFPDKTSRLKGILTNEFTGLFLRANLGDKHRGLRGNEADEILGTKDVSLNFLAGCLLKLNNTEMYKETLSGLFTNSWLELDQKSESANYQLQYPLY